MTAPSITDYYQKDHDRLEELFKTFQDLKRTDFAKAKAAFVEFKFGLQRHIVWEEDILFPIFERKTGMGETGPTVVMRMEHRLIGDALELIHQQVAQESPESDKAEQELLSVLSQHNEKEENILYPAIDRSVNEEEREDIFQRMKNVPPERYESCCGG